MKSRATSCVILLSICLWETRRVEGRADRQGNEVFVAVPNARHTVLRYQYCYLRAFTAPRTFLLPHRAALLLSAAPSVAAALSHPPRAIARPRPLPPADPPQMRDRSVE